MVATRRFILFELNEVPVRVVQHFAERHPRSAFARILAGGRRWDTLTPDQGHLSPWITWPTLHRGVSSAEHHIVALGQDLEEVDSRYPPVWTLLARAGRRVGMFGSLHSYPLPEELDNFDFYVPDTFAAGPETKPAELSAFQRFNLRMVDGSGRNVSSELPMKEAFDFLTRMLPSGIRGATLAKIAKQLATERVWPDRTGRRRTIQSLLAFDLFLAQLQAKRPDAAFFFSNHVASSMHRYWPATFPDDYRAAKWGADWVRRFSGELDYTMSEADQMLAELISFGDRNPEYLVFVSGSMGQAAVDDPGRQIRSEVLVRDMARLLSSLGVEGSWHRRRTMEPTYTLFFEDHENASRFMEAIRSLKIAGQHIDHRRLDAHGVEFVLGHKNITDRDLSVTIDEESIVPAAAGLANVVIDDEVGSAAYHVPEGMLLAYDPRVDWAGEAASRTIATTSIAPTLLALEGVAVPAYMQAPVQEILSTNAAEPVPARTNEDSLAPNPV